MKYILLSGGTGGHIYPALSVYYELERRGHKVYIVTDIRGIRIINNDKINTILINSYGYSGLILNKARSILYIFKNIYDFILIFNKLKPDMVWGFGSYVSLSGLFVAYIMHIKNGLYHHDLVLTRVNYIAQYFTKYITTMHQDIKMNNSHVIGAIMKKEFTYTYHKTCKNNILIIGGSQGSSIWNIMPEILYNLDVNILHQTNDIKETTKYYAKYNIQNVKIVKYIENMSKAIQEANIIFSRAGIMSILEILFHNKYAFYLPIKNSVNDHQLYNALWVEKNKYGEIIHSFSNIRDKISSLLSKENTIHVHNIDFQGHVNLANFIENNSIDIKQ